MQNCSFCIWWEMYDKHCRIVLETKINIHFCISQNHSVLLIHYFLFICFHTQIEQPNTLLQHWNVEYKSQRFLHFCLSLTCLSLTESERVMLNFQLFTPKVKKKIKNAFPPQKMCFWKNNYNYFEIRNYIFWLYVTISTNTNL